jgi:inner membrane protein
MDIVTQGVLGAAVGYAVLGRRLGGKAIWLGACGGILPDLDVLAVESSSVDYWTIHRGITHSFFFAPVVGVLLAALSGWIAQRARSPSRADASITFRSWYAFWFWVLITHPMLDLMTTYGTQIFAPFTQVPYGFSAVSIIDPVYTLLLVAGLIMAAVWRHERPRAVRFMLAMLAASSAYLAISGYQNVAALRLAKADAARVGLQEDRIHAYTTVFSPWLRRIVLEQPDALQVGFVSTLNPQPIRWTRIERDPQAEAMAALSKLTRPGAVFARFAVGPQIARIVVLDAKTDIDLKVADATQGLAATAPRALRIYDARFGIPGPSLAGFWGVEIPLSAAGFAPEKARRFTVDRRPQPGDLVAFGRAKLGLAQERF